LVETTTNEFDESAARSLRALEVANTMFVEEDIPRRVLEVADVVRTTFEAACTPFTTVERADVEN
jgi:hypothetical protein